MAGDVDKTIEAMGQPELVKMAQLVLDSGECAENDFTEMVRDIVRRGYMLSSKQRGTVESFLSRNKRLWY